jgi:acyl-coenzyme A thioesterase PaaI-like protein
VIRAGKTVTVCWGEVVAFSGPTERLVATMVGTMMTVEGRGLSD